MVVDILLKQLIKLARRPDTAPSVMDPGTFIREFRTVRLGIPRQLGKTTALVALARSEPAIFFAPTSPLARQIERIHALEVIELTALDNRLIQSVIVKTPITLALVDEGLDLLTETQNKFYALLSRMWADNQLDRDTFVVVLVGT